MNTSQLETPSLIQSTGKAIGFTVMGAVSAFSIFVIMSKLAENQNTYVEPQTTLITPELGAVKEDSDTAKIEKKLPDPPKPSERPEQPPKQVANNDNILDGMRLGPIEVEGPNIGIPGPTLGGLSEGTATAIVRVEPRYPVKAARDGVEGWVSLSFSVDEVGRVTNVKVIEAQPRHYFEKEARKALKKWRYKPRIENGQAVAQHNQTILLEFNMSGS